MLLSSAVAVAVVALLAIAGVAHADNLLEYNASGTVVKVPQLNNISMSNVHVLTYFTGTGNLTVSVKPFTPTACDFKLEIHYPNGALAANLTGRAEPFIGYNTTVRVNIGNYSYVVIEGSVCNIEIPPYAVRYYQQYITPPADPVIQLFWSIACYSPAVAIFLRSSPRTGGIAMLASLPISVPIMYALGADPTIIPIFTTFIAIISLLMIVVE